MRLTILAPLIIAMLAILTACTDEADTPATSHWLPTRTSWPCPR